MAPSVLVSCAWAALGGHTSYILYFHRYECHMYIMVYLNTLLLSCGGGFLALTKMYGYSNSAAAVMTAEVAASFLASLYGSMLFYRAFLNPLNKIPGPYLARFGNLYMSWKFADSQAYKRIQTMHKKYGYIVRMGSNDVSIADPDVMEAAYGRDSRATKGWWYENDYPFVSMHSTRSRALHDKRRKVWSPAFSERALRDYESKIGIYSDLLVKKIAERKGQPIDMTTWFNLFSFDVMTRLAFGNDYKMLERGVKQHELELLDEGLQPLAYFFPTWVFRIFFAIPFLASGFHKFIAFCVNELNQRVASEHRNDEKSTDVMSWILKAYEGHAHPEKDPMLQADSRLIIIAGSDTTAITFTFMFYHLATNPDQVEKLREELKSLCTPGWSDKEINSAPHLNAIIFEALRMHPPLPSGVQRLTPPEGMQVDGRHLPGNVVFYVPQLVMGRDERIYPEPDSFIPERWSTRKDLVKHEKAFAPFSIGPYGCIGRDLAMRELRTTTAKLILKYNIALAPGEDGTRLIVNSGEHITFNPGQLDLVFTEV